MAAEMVGGAFLSASLQVLFDRLASQELIDLINGNKPIHRLLKEFKIKLLSANLVPNDAEEKQLGDPSVKEWLDQLKEAVFDSEDFMADFRALAVEEGSTPKVLRLFSSFYKAAMKSRLSEIVGRLDFMLKEKDVLGLKEGVLLSSHSARLSAGLADECVVYGRDLDKGCVVNMLLRDENADGDEIPVVSIVGMGGIGKTTLAQLVYDDERVDGHFDVKAWVGVSDKFDAFRVTRIVFESVTSSPCETSDLRQLQVKLKNALRGKMFLIVLDDVWTENYMHWDLLRSTFESGARGSRIVVTTRSDIVASKVSNVPAYHLQTISDEACWQLFAKHALNGVDLKEHSILQVIGGQIVRKCKGLPLAVKSLGGLLRSVVNPEEWGKILRSDIWKLTERETNVLPALWLSYHYLPPHLKRCFAYCSIFPKGYKITKEKLIMLWMGEDLLQPVHGKRVEEVGNEYFFDLVSRSLFQKVHHNQPFFKMHDLVNELARFISGEFCSRLDDNNSPVISAKTRHLSYMKRNINSVTKFKALFDAKYLRTFLPLGWNEVTRPFPWNDLLLHDLIPTVPFLRVLSLSEYPITELPDSLGHLKHLRYLDLSWTNVKTLPRTFCSLCNLQTLILAHCRYLTQLPVNMGKLINLRYLDIECTGIKDMPQQICKLNNLHVLTDFILSEGSGSSIKQLRELKQLQGYLCISGLQNVVDVEDVVEASLRDKKFIKRLHLKWDWRNDAEDSLKERMILDCLMPHKSLKELFILGYGGTRFPDWVGNHNFSHISVVSLNNCRNCCVLPPLGRLPSLKKLSIRGFKELMRIGVEFCLDASYTSKPFRCLEVLRFADMPEWQEWVFIGTEDNTHFPNLKELSLKDCPRLIHGLPDHLPSLKTLYISGCQRLTIRLQSDGHLDKAFPSLCSMEISNCPVVESFLETGIQFPSNLNELSIIKCRTLFASRMSWNLQRLSSLMCLRIRSMYEPAMDLFPEAGLLPTTLISLSVSNLPNVKVLNGKGFEHMVSLKQLWISSCLLLQSLPEGLPKSLTYLFTSDCPLLNQRCRREIGEDWSKISYITRVRIDGEFV